MNAHLQDLLARRADSVDPPRLDPLVVLTRGERLVRRRRGLVAAGTALAVTCAVAAATLVLDPRGEETTPQPANPAEPAWLPLDTVADGTEELDPGDYGMTAAGLPDMPWAVLTVPAGFANLDGWLLKDPEDGPVRGVGYWTVSGVDRDPCASVPVPDARGVIGRGPRSRVGGPEGSPGPPTGSRQAGRARRALPRAPRAKRHQALRLRCRSIQRLGQ